MELSENVIKEELRYAKLLDHLGREYPQLLTTRYGTSYKPYGGTVLPNNMQQAETATDKNSNQALLLMLLVGARIQC